MDRNKSFPGFFVGCIDVALRKESVDRNLLGGFGVCLVCVALRQESVVRNCSLGAYPADGSGSLSARRAWIEIPAGCWRDARRVVALRKESVDRNCYLDNIEITQAVALRKESVDRNAGQ